MVKKTQKETDLMDPKGGVFEGEFLTAERVMQLADIPSKEQLLGMLVWTMVAPISGFMNAVTGNVKGLTVALSEMSQKDA